MSADLACNPRQRQRLRPRVSLVVPEMITGLERIIDTAVAEHPLRPVFVVSGANGPSAARRGPHHRETCGARDDPGATVAWGSQSARHHLPEPGLRPRLCAGEVGRGGHRGDRQPLLRSRTHSGLDRFSRNRGRSSMSPSCAMIFPCPRSPPRKILFLITTPSRVLNIRGCAEARPDGTRFSSRASPTWLWE